MKPQSYLTETRSIIIPREEFVQLSNLHCAARERGLHHSKSAGSGSAVPGGAATCSEGFVVNFLKVPLACWGSSVAAVQPNSLGNSQFAENILQNLSEQVAAPPGR